MVCPWPVAIGLQSKFDEAKYRLNYNVKEMLFWYISTEPFEKALNMNDWGLAKGWFGRLWNWNMEEKEGADKNG